MNEIRKKLAELSNGESGKAAEKLALRRSTQNWRSRSLLIGLRILCILREKNMSQKDLADALQITPQQVNKIVKGNENMTLDTIAAFEAALGVQLIEVIRTGKKYTSFQRNDLKDFRQIKPISIVQKYIDMDDTIQYTIPEYQFDDRNS